MSDPIGPVTRKAMTAAQIDRLEAVLGSMKAPKIVSSQYPNSPPGDCLCGVSDGARTHTFTIYPNGDRELLGSPARDEEKSSVALTNLVATVFVPEAPVEERAETLQQFVREIAQARIEPGESEKVTNSRVAWESVEMLEGLIDAAHRAAQLERQRIVANGFGFLTDDEEWTELYEGLQSITPTPAQQASSGKNRQVAAWTHKAVKTLKDAGIGAAEVAVVNAGTDKTILSIGNSAVNRIEEDSDIPEEEKVDYYRELLDDMQSLASRPLAKKWAGSDVPDVRLQIHSHLNTLWQTIVIEAQNQAQVNRVLSRLRGFYILAGDLYPPLTLRQLKEESAETLVRIAALQDPIKRVLHHYVKREGPVPFTDMEQVAGADRNTTAKALAVMVEHELIEQDQEGGVLVWR